MSIDLYVLSNKALPDTAAWQKAIDANGHPLQLKHHALIQDLGGFLPVAVGEEESGFECSAIDIEEIKEMAPDMDFGGEWTLALAFYFQGDMAEGYAANVAAAAYAKATGGVVFEPQGGTLYSEADSLKDIAFFQSQMA